MLYQNLGPNGKGWNKISFARQDMGCDAYLCCPGPSLQNIERGRGRKIFAINTAYPKIKPDVWMGLDRVECYDRAIWAEPFVKICRGNYTEMEVQGKKVKYFDNVFFASIKQAENNKTLFDYLNHEDSLLWYKNTLATMLHLIIKMGAKTIYLAGCDMGGNYYDNRIIDPDHKIRNERLYKQQIEFLKKLNIQCNSKGIELISVTPNSPLNEFLQYKELDTALKESEGKVQVFREPIYHCLKAEEINERNLYRKIWEQEKENYRSPRSEPIVDLIYNKAKDGKKVLEIGSGDGNTLKRLKELAIDITGTDIYATNSDIIETPAWDLSRFEDKSFDIVCSTDVLEHIPPEFLDKTISELRRVGKLNIHFIACHHARFDRKIDNEVVHKSVFPIAEWKKRFDESDIIEDVGSLN